MGENFKIDLLKGKGRLYKIDEDNYEFKFSEVLEISTRVVQENAKFTIKVFGYDILKVESSCICTSGEVKNNEVELGIKPKKEGSFNREVTLILDSKEGRVYKHIKLIGSGK